MYNYQKISPEEFEHLTIEYSNVQIQLDIERKEEKRFVEEQAM